MRTEKDLGIGLPRGEVKLLPHDTAWERIAEQTIKSLRKTLGGFAVDIRHIGSTAIKTIAAKPIIDIAVGVTDLSETEKYIDALRRIGIIYRFEEHGGILFVIGDIKRDTRTHHIHFVSFGGVEWNDYVNFVDYLNFDGERALFYESVKIELAEKYPHDRDAYTRGKAQIISQLLEEAAEWRKNS